MTRELYKQFQPWTWIEGNRMYASFGHLTGYSSNYYTYMFDKVIALDFFAQFDPDDLLGCEAGARYRKTVLEQGGSKPGREMVRDFLGRDEEFAAFTKWLNEEFEGQRQEVSELGIAGERESVPSRGATWKEYYVRNPMTAKDFKRIALSLEGAEEGSHMGAADFRVGGGSLRRCFRKEGYGNLMLTPEIQAEFLRERPDLFLPVHGGWGRTRRDAHSACGCG